MPTGRLAARCTTNTNTVSDLELQRRASLTAGYLPHRWARRGLQDTHTLRASRTSPGSYSRADTQLRHIKYTKSCTEVSDLKRGGGESFMSSFVCRNKQNHEKPCRCHLCGSCIRCSRVCRCTCWAACTPCSSHTDVCTQLQHKHQLTATEAKEAGRGIHFSFRESR